MCRSGKHALLWTGLSQSSSSLAHLSLRLEIIQGNVYISLSVKQFSVIDNVFSQLNPVGICFKLALPNPKFVGISSLCRLVSVARNGFSSPVFLAVVYFAFQL